MPALESSSKSVLIANPVVRFLNFLRKVKHAVYGVASVPLRLEHFQNQIHSLESKVHSFEAAQNATTSSIGTCSSILENYESRLAAFDSKMTSLETSLSNTMGFLNSIRADVAQLPKQETLSRLSERIIKEVSACIGASATPGLPAPIVQATQAPASEPHHGHTINKIGFLIHSKELIHHFSCVWNLLPDGSFDVVLHGNNPDISNTDFEQWSCNTVSSGELIASNTKYQYLVSNHPVAIGEKPLLKQLALYNVRFMYAAGKSGWNLSGWNNLYDLIMCFGPHHAAAFSNCSTATVLQMGYPRFDRYFNSHPSKQELLSQYGCDPSKETVVWLPTWKTLSSVTHYDQEISALMEHYNVVVKLHPLMPGSEPERVVALKKHHFTHLITDASDNLPLYQLADYMLFDYGGPPLAGVYTGKRIILLNVPGALVDDLTDSDSPDLRIRKDLASVNPEDRKIAELLQDQTLWSSQQAALQRLRQMYFAPYFGFSSNIAANALLSLDKIFGISPEAKATHMAETRA